MLYEVSILSERTQINIAHHDIHFVLFEIFGGLRYGKIFYAKSNQDKIREKYSQKTEGIKSCKL